MTESVFEFYSPLSTLSRYALGLCKFQFPVSLDNPAIQRQRINHGQ